VEPVGPSRAGSEVDSCLASRIEAALAPIECPRVPLEGISAQSTAVPAETPRTGSPVAAVIVPPSAAVLGIELSCFAAGKPVVASVADSVGQELSIDLQQASQFGPAIRLGQGPKYRQASTLFGTGSAEVAEVAVVAVE
jgi:hypothetical protein